MGLHLVYIEVDGEERLHVKEKCPKCDGLTVNMQTGAFCDDECRKWGGFPPTEYRPFDNPVPNKLLDAIIGQEKGI